MTTDAPCRVLTSATLFRLITSYQRGMPAGIFHFWCAHEENASIPASELGSTFTNRLDIPGFIAEHGDAQLLKLLPFITETLPPRRLSHVCRVAAKKNDTDMLQWAIDHGYLHTADALFVVVSLGSSNSRALALMEKQHAVLARVAPQSLFTGRLYSEIKDVAMIEWLHAHIPQLVWNLPKLAEAAVYGSRLEVLRYVYTRDASIKWNFSQFAFYSSPAGCECLRFLLRDHAQEMVSGDLASLLTFSPLEVLQIVNDFKYLFRDAVEKAIQVAVANERTNALGRFVSVGWVNRNERVPIDRWKVTGATLFLLERGLAVATDITMHRAAEAGRWDIVHYLHEHCSMHYTTRTMHAAAKQGRLDQVKLLHHASSGLSLVTNYTIDYAAEAGNWDIVHYLHELTSVRCTTRTMNAAAKQGRLDQVKFLHDQRTEGCSCSAVWDALDGGHRAVIEYLFTHYRHLFKGKLATLLLHDEFAIWEALRDEYPAETEKSISDALSCASRHYYLSTVHYILDKLGRRDLAYKAMCEAAQASEMAWVVAVWRAAGPQSCTMQVVRFTVRWCYGSSSRVKFVIDNCIEPNAREQAIQYVREENWTQLADELQRGWTSTPGDSIELHPWLLDARTPKWVVERLLKALGHYKDDWYNRVGAMTWPIEAAYRCDVTVLAMTLEASHSAATSGDTDPDPELSFEGARAAAVRIGDVPTVQWLLEHVDMPVESTLLDEALFYHRYEVALWLATYCPEACTALEPEPRPRPMDKDPGYSDSMRKWLDTWKYKDCGYDASLRQWLETDGAILRQFIDIDMIPWEKSGREEAK